LLSLASAHRVRVRRCVRARASGWGGRRHVQGRWRVLVQRRGQVQRVPHLEREERAVAEVNHRPRWPNPSPSPARPSSYVLSYAPPFAGSSCRQRPAGGAKAARAQTAGQSSRSASTRRVDVHVSVVWRVFVGTWAENSSARLCEEWCGAPAWRGRARVTRGGRAASRRSGEVIDAVLHSYPHAGVSIVISVLRRQGSQLESG
jgi:hypothetical protein